MYSTVHKSHLPCPMINNNLIIKEFGFSYLSPTLSGH